MIAQSRRPSSSSLSAEYVRQDNVNKYYQPWLDFAALNGVPADTGPSQEAKRSLPDATLTAFAQLAALRLNVKRGMVSLIGTQTQTILAEATQTVSLIDEARHAPGDHIWLGNVALPRADCMDEHTLTSLVSFHDDHGGEVEIPAFIVPDTLEDDRFKNRPYVRSGNSVRFYAGVPIVTKQGHAIGAYAVSDTKPRPGGLKFDEVLFMSDVAQLIAEHLDRLMGSMGRISERDFMRGISYFLEDLNQFKYKISNANKTKHTKPSENNDIRATDPQPLQSRGRRSGSGSDQVVAPNSTSIKRDNGPPASYNDRAPQYQQDNENKNGEDNDSSKGNIRRIFVHAAQLICEQGKAAGCVFVDAASSQSMVKVTPLGSDPCDIANTELDVTDDEESDTAEMAEPSDDASGHLGGFEVACGGGRNDMADVLGIALAEDCNDEVRSGIIKRKKLMKFIMRYPFGKCFYLNRGRIVQDDCSVEDESITGGGGLHQDTTEAPGRFSDPLVLPREVLKRIPNAKWLIFLPLFNYSQSQWCAGGFIWGTDFKMGDPDDALPYFKTFGSCVMSEVASMDVLNTNIAKSTFIASISHDLRSPLHGLLGNLEFLEDTLTTAYQMGLSEAMETCGKTLLDTIDHLLDYAKINNLRSQSRSSDKKKLRVVAPTSQQYPAITPFDLSVLLEEVVETVFAGQTFRKTNMRHRDPVDESMDEIKEMSLDHKTPFEEQIQGGSAKFSGKVFLILDIEKRSWVVLGQTGALRRVIMNVVGNAIKYCSEGSIEISLKAKKVNSRSLDVEIVVKDTGIGMSKDFLANHLFKPFSQEDSFTPGTGLGLSITSQIVSNLQGKITIASEVGIGTHVTIAIPFEIGSPSHASEFDGDIKEATDVTFGKKVCILDPPLPGDSHENPQFTKLESSLSSIFETWFRMEVIRSQTFDADPNTTIYIYAEPPPISYLTEHHFKRRHKGKEGKDSALLIVCTNIFEAASLLAAGVEHLTSLGQIIEVISQPVGVRKLSKVLQQCVRRLKGANSIREEHMMDVGISSTGPALPIREVKEKASQIKWNATPVTYDHLATRYRPSVDALRWKSHEPELSGTPIAYTRPGSPLLSITPTTDQLARSDADVSKSGHHSPRVLLVDDNAINLKLLVTFMKKINLPYAEASNGLEAYERFCEADNDKAFNVVLMDLQMPVMDGLESTRKIREYEQKVKTQSPALIIAITGVGNEIARQQALDAGMSDFFTKPVRLKTLQQLLLNNP